MRFLGVANAVPLLALAGFGYAQFPPTPEGVTVLDSRFGDGVQLSWKEVRLSCETSMVSSANNARTTSARLRKAFVVTLAMSIFRLGVSMIWAKSRIIRSIRSFGL
jgi:hypothetical protein